MENQITLEQALINVDLVLGNFKGTKQKHIALETSFNKIKENLCACKKD